MSESVSVYQYSERVECSGHCQKPTRGNGSGKDGLAESAFGVTKRLTVKGLTRLEVQRSG